MAKVLPSAEIKAIIETEYELVPLGRERHGTARRYRFADGKGEIGFISPVTEPFCGDCNRIRLTAEGMLRTCLFSMNETDLRAPLRDGRDRRRGRADRPRRRLAQGAQAPRRRAGLRPAAALDVADRRVSPARDRRGLGAGRGARRAAAASSASRSTDAAGRIAAEDARSAVDLPPFDRSAMDGYAVRAADTDPPAPLRDRRRGRGRRGGRRARSRPGTALGITTGAALPDGADAILRVEDAARRRRPRDAGRAARRPGTHVRYRGEDVARGDVLAPAGAPLTVQRVTALASAGVGEVAVRRRPVVHVLATGTELLEVGRAAGAGPDPRVQPADAAAARRARRRRGRRCTRSCPTTPPPPARRSRPALAGDVLLVSGGVSVGPHDHVKPALEAAGVEEVFWRVRLKPGKPLWFGRRGATLVFGLPGNPLSTVACFLLFVGPGAAADAGRGRTPSRPASRRGSTVPAAPGRRPHDAAHRPPRARRRRHARGHADRGPGLPPDRRARRRPTRSRSSRTRPASSRPARSWTRSCCSVACCRLSRLSRLRAAPRRRPRSARTPCRCPRARGSRRGRAPRPPRR